MFFHLGGEAVRDEEGGRYTGAARSSQQRQPVPAE